jgi:hypothetical protein
MSASYNPFNECNNAAARPHLLPQGRPETLVFLSLSHIRPGLFHGGQKSFQIIPSYLDKNGFRRAPSLNFLAVKIPAIEVVTLTQHFSAAFGALH